MPVHLVRPPDLTDQAPYAYASVVGPGSLVFTAGACPLDREGVVAPVGDLVGQTEVTLANLEVALRAAGAGLADVAKSTVYVATDRRADLVAVWDVVTRVFGDHDPPSTLLAVPLLGYDNQLVEIEAIAATGPG